MNGMHNLIAMLAVLNAPTTATEADVAKHKQPQHGNAARSRPKATPPQHAKIKVGQRAARKKRRKR